MNTRTSRSRPATANHRRYLPRLIGLVRSGQIDPAAILSQVEPISDAIAAYEAFDQRQAGWLKVKLEPDSAPKH